MFISYIFDHLSLLFDGINRYHCRTNLLSYTTCFPVLDMGVTYLQTQKIMMIFFSIITQVIIEIVALRLF